MSSTETAERGWSELLGPGFRTTSIVLAGGVLLHAVNIFLTSSLLPTAVGELGGEHLYAWSTTVFMVASVVSSTAVARLLGRRGALGAYLMALAPFILGTLVCATSPWMELLLVGRALQGIGGGLLAGLGIAVINSALPERLWGRATGLVSAMWGIGTLAGPVLGGAFAQLGQWRGAFFLVAALGIGMAVILPRALPRTERVATSEPVPVVSLGLLTAAATAISIAAILEDRSLMVLLIAVGVVAVIAFLLWERQGAHTVLPRHTYRRGSRLRWIYLTAAVLAAATAAEAFAPLFGQRLAGLAPFAAGFLGAAISIGWSFANIVSANVDRPRTQSLLMLTGPAVLAGGLLVAALLQRTDASAATVLLWAAALTVAGVGIGIAFPHLVVAAMKSSDDEHEAAKSAAGINTVELTAVALGSAVAGVLVNLGSMMLQSAQLLFTGLAVIAALGVISAVRATRGRTS